MTGLYVPSMINVQTKYGVPRLYMVIQKLN